MEQLDALVAEAQKRWKKNAPASRADRVDPAIRYEWPDPTPIEQDVPMAPAPNTLAKLLAEQRLLQAQAAALDKIDETFEESDDFDVPDDPIDYAQTRWEIAADAALMTPHQLFEAVYGHDKAAEYREIHEENLRLSREQRQTDRRLKREADRAAAKARSEVLEGGQVGGAGAERKEGGTPP